jgi:hypothetical protein
VIAVLSQIICFFTLFFVENLFPSFEECYGVFTELFRYPETYLALVLTVGIGYTIQLFTYKVCEERTIRPKKVEHKDDHQAPLL